MELPLRCVFGECEVHTVIYILTEENLSVSAVHKWLQNMYRVEVMPKCTVYLWVRRFLKEKRKNIRNDARNNQPSNISSDEMRHTVLTILKHDRLTICEIRYLVKNKHGIKV